MDYSTKMSSMLCLVWLLLDPYPPLATHAPLAPFLLSCQLLQLAAATQLLRSLGCLYYYCEFSMIHW